MLKALVGLYKRFPLLSELLVLLIISVPTFISILNGQYFSMHDDQHIARLFLLDKGIKQGYLYPRWVDMLGFGFGYPLFNFYPPLIYYVAEVFHLLFGLTFIWSIKATFITGFIGAAAGLYLLVRKLAGRATALLSSLFYSYFYYHAVISFVRGALAEFFSMAVLPFVFLAIMRLGEKITLKNSLLFGIALAALILTHPLIAFPSVFYIGFFFLFYLIVLKKDKIKFILHFAIGGITGIALSAFFWLPSLTEKKFTFVDDILTKELANYKIHFIFPQQFIYSPWGYGGSIEGPFDGMTFQLGKIHILAIIGSLLLFAVYWFYRRKFDTALKHYVFFVLLTLFSLFMTTAYSSFIWDSVSFLWYLQFPWRFLTFAGIFIGAVAGFSLYFIDHILKEAKFAHRIRQYAVVIFILVTSAVIVYKYTPYFKPQRLLPVSDSQLTSFEDIAWRISRTSFEFVSKGVKTTKTPLGTTTLDIKKENLPKEPGSILFGAGQVKVRENRMSDKTFVVHAEIPSSFRLNTYNFPGWKAYINGKEVPIRDDNDLKLITIDVPQGYQTVSFSFKETGVRKFADIISIFTVTAVLVFLIPFNKLGIVISKKRSD